MDNNYDVGNKSAVFDKLINNNEKDYQLIKDIKVYPYISDKNKVLDVSNNLNYLLKQLDIDIKYNLMSRKREITIPNTNFLSENIENITLDYITDIALLNHMPVKFLDNHLDVIATQNSYHPIVELLKNNPWDKKPRLDNFLKTIKTTNDPLSHKLIKTWMVAAIAAAHSKDGFTNQGVLTIQGAQNIGKTKWIKSLNPFTDNIDVVKEGAILDPNNKDNILMLASYWIVELGEVDATFRKADIARLKSFITMQSDNVRSPYARKSTILPRRTVYAATVNEENFLADETGNRRWWTISAISIDCEHDFPMTKVWAEVYWEWMEGHLTYLDNEYQDKVNCSNIKHEKVDPLKELLYLTYNFESDPKDWVSSTQILQCLGYDLPQRSESTRIGIILSKIKSIKSKILDGIKLYHMPYKRSSYYSQI